MEPHQYEKRIIELENKLENMKNRAVTLRERFEAAESLADKAKSELEELRSGGFKKGPFKFDGLTIIVAYYNIPKHIERTLTSCSPHYQKAPKNKIEVIIADNGSDKPLPRNIRKKFPFVSKVIRTQGKPSPVFALNDAIKHAKFNTIALMIDGAHILSPGVFQNTRDICQMFARPVINIPQYFLGNFSQNLNQEPDAWKRETRMLGELNWPKDGYSLFRCALIPGEIAAKSIMSSIESNCLIAKRKVFEECGAFDERFDEPGAGFANLEMFTRLTNHEKNTYVMFPGEGSFHQDHDGTTTKKTPEERVKLVDRYREDYTAITGRKTLPNISGPMMYGIRRKSCENIPSISRQFGMVKANLLRQLSSIYTHRALNGIKNNRHPKLVANLPDERMARPPLLSKKLAPELARQYNVKPGQLQYLWMLRKIHEIRKPGLYFEIGVDQGKSLALSKCASIGVDPDFSITVPIPTRTRLFKEPSDGFFENAERAEKLFARGIDLAFIDGMHLAEFVIRDFINVERYCTPNSMIMFDDVLPEQREMAERVRGFNVWTGDVYKVVEILREYRPDLEIEVFETFIGSYRKGLGVVKNLNPDNFVLQSNYDNILQGIIGGKYNFESIEAMEKKMKIKPHGAFKDFISK